MLRGLLIVIFLLASCDSELALSPDSQKLKKPTIDTLNKVTAKEGDEITFVGQNLTADMEVSVGGVLATYILDDNTKGSLIIPAGAASEDGIMKVSFSVKKKSIMTFPIVNSDAVESQPVLSIPEEHACSTLVYKNEAGEMVRGKANCAILTPCSEDGEAECWATAEVPAVPKVNLESKLATGISFGSVTGAACSVDDPLVATLSGEPAVSSNAPNLNVTVSGDGITHYKYKIRESSDPACSDPSGYSSERSVLQVIDDDLTTFADGPLQLCILGKDAEGNWQDESNASTISWTKDNLPPTALLSNVPSGINNSSVLNVSVGGTDVTHYKYKIRDALATPCSDSSDYSSAIAVASAIGDSITAIADGPLEICVIGRDAAGNWQAEAAATTATWTKDSLAPAATISGEPTGTNNTTVLNVTVAGADVSHYKYKIRSTADATCSASSGYSTEAPVGTVISADFSAVADGALELCVIGRDAAGNWQTEATAATASWTKDALPPAAILSGAPTGTSLGTALNITVAGTDVVEYKYKIRESSDPACSNSAGYSSAIALATHITDNISAKADGVVQVCVIGKDSIGNWQLEGTATIASWTKDTTAPAATISNAPAATNNTTVLDVTIAGTDVTHYKYKIRESADAACSVAAGYSGETAVATKITSNISALSDGAIELCVIAKDTAGNWQTEATATTASWTKDATAPSASFSGEPTGTNATTTLNVTVAGAAVTHYKFKVRETADPACSNSAGYSSEVAVGTAITSDISGLGDGALELCVIGRDASGNWQAEASAAAASWTKDALPPVATISGQPTGSSLSTALNITVAGADVLEYKYKIRETADPACSNSTGYSAAIVVATHITDDISALADGVIQVCVIGKDASNNWQLEGTATTASWTKDTAAPTATISDAPTATNNTTVLDVTIAGTDVTHYKYKIREPADTACSIAAGYSGEIAVATKVTSNISALGDGAIELCVIGRDAAGNWQAEASAATAAWTKDTAAPTASVSGEPTGTNATITLNITVAGTDVSHYKFKVRESADPACSNATGYSSEAPVATAITSDISGLGDGVLQLCVVGRDAYGNWQAEASATTASWTKDALPPAATLSGQPTGSSLTTSLDITVAGADVVEYKYKIRETADLACSDSTGYSAAIAVATHITNDISALADGVIQVCVIGKDGSGNWQLEGTSTSASWTKDTVAPSADIIDEPTGTNGVATLNVTIGGTGVSHYKYKIREPATTACSNSADYSSETAVATKITDSLSSLAEGSIELCVIGRDAAGNWQVEASATTVSWTKDTTAPTATISGEPTGTNATTTLNISVAGADVTHYKYKIRESADPACSNSAGYSSEIAVATAITDSLSSVGDGSLQLCLIGRDSQGNWQAEASATAATWTKDTTAPTAIISGAPGASSPVTSLDITISGADVVEYKYKIRGAATSACSNSADYSSAIVVATHITDDISAMAEGAIEVCVIGKDSAGNWQLEANASAATWTKDTVAPTATISNAPTATNNTTVLDVTIAGTDVSHYKYKLRESADTACSVAAGYSAEIAVATKISNNISAYADGALELCVIGRDAAGNWQAEASAATASWTKDATAPTATISGEPTGTNNTTTLNVTIAGVTVTHYKYKIRESADTTCSNATGYSSEIAVATAIIDSISGKSDGTIELCVIGRDSYGNWQTEASATAVNWTKDTAAPTAILSGEPSGSSLTTVLDITVSGADLVEYKYKIRESPDTACSDSTGYSSAIAVATHITNNISAKADGTIEVCVIGKDSQGNWQLEASATSESWTKDTVAPTATISGEPTGTNNTTTLNITIAGTDVTEYKYKVRDTSTSACSNSADYSSAVAAATAITDSISSFADGAMEICVIGRDAAGNWQHEASASTETWTKDSTAPSASIAGEPTGTNNTTTLNVTVAGADVTHYKYKIRASADTACSNATGYSSEVAVATAITDSFSGKADGTIELCVIGRDTYGNWQAETSATAVSWTKDTTAPTATLSGQPTGSSLSTILNITVAGADVVEYKYKIRESADTACTDSTGYSSAIAVATHITNNISAKADGTIEVCVIGKDVQGNWQLEVSATIESWTKDTVAPTATISGEPAGTNNTTTLNITIAGTGVTEYKYKVRDTSTSACSNSADYSSAVAVATPITDSISSFADGTMEICVIGRDAAGNWQLEASASTETWTKDATAPSATIAGEPTGTNNTTVLNVTIAGTDVTHYKYKIRESADTACSNTTGYSSEVAVASAITDSISGKADGTIQLCVIGRDTYGNWQAEASATTVSWTKDATPPGATLSGQPSGSSLATALDVTVGGADVVEYKYKIRVPADTACSDSADYSSAVAVGSHITDNITAKADGTIQICVIGKDSVGNWQLEASATTASWTKDTAAPTATISNAPSGTNATTTLDVTIAGTDVTHYKYKVRASADSACSVTSDYSGEVAVATHITADISAKADGTIELCVIGRDAAGNWQLESAAATTSWTKNATPPTASISGQPTGTSNVTTLNVTVSGSNMTHYKYKIRASADAACSDSSNYSSDVALATAITGSISAKADGTIEICVVGLSPTGVYQTYGSASSVTWTKDTVAAAAPTAFTVSPRESSLKSYWTSGGGDTTGFLVLRRASTTISDAPTAGTSYTIGSTIGSSTVAYVGASLTLADTSLVNGTKYFYRIFAYDAAKNYSSGLIAWGRPIGYEPPSADSLLFWTDASYTDSLFTDSSCTTAVTAANDTVGCQKDLTSYASVLTQATSGNRPVYKTTNVYGHPGTQHSNSHWLTAASTNIPSGNLQHSLVYIGSFGDTNTSGAIHIGGSSFDSKIRLYGHVSWLTFGFGGNELFYAAPSTNPQLFIGSYNGVDGTTTNRKMYFNGIENTSLGNAGFPTNTLNLPSNPGVTIGSDSSGTENLTGDVGEFLLYDHDLSSSEIAELSRYAWNKWSIPQITLSAASTPSSIVLSWTDGTASPSYLLVKRASSAPTFTPTNGVSYVAGPQGSDTIVSASSALTYTDSSVVAGTTYHYALYGNDGSNNYTPVVSTNAKPLVSPSLSITTDDTKLNLSWAAVAEASGYLIVRQASSAPTFTPTNGTTYSTGAQGSDTIVYVSNTSSFQDTGLTNGTAYYYKLFAYDSAHNYASSTSQSGTPVSPCSGSTTTYTSNGSVTMPSGCTTVEIEAWGGGGGAGRSNNAGSEWSGAGGKGGKVIWNNVTAGVSVSSGATIQWVIGQGGLCGATRTGGNGSAEGTSTTTGRGGAGGNAGVGSVGIGVGASGGNGGGSVSGYAGGKGYYGGGGGGAGEGGGGGGGGATAVAVAGTVRAIAGGGGGGGGANAQIGTNGGGGCGGSGSMSSAGGAGGGGGDCLGTSETVSGGAAGGSITRSTTCVNSGTAGKVIVTFSP